MFQSSVGIRVARSCNRTLYSRILFEGSQVVSGLAALPTFLHVSSEDGDLVAQSTNAGNEFRTKPYAHRGHRQICTIFTKHSVALFDLELRFVTQWRSFQLHEIVTVKCERNERTSMSPVSLRDQDCALSWEFA